MELLNVRGGVLGGGERWRGSASQGKREDWVRCGTPRPLRVPSLVHCGYQPAVALRRGAATAVGARSGMQKKGFTVTDRPGIIAVPLHFYVLVR